jgi:acetoin utilization protein AcuB
MRGAELVGIITETNLFRIFLELLGARQAGIRVTASVPNRPGELAGLAKAIYDRGGNIISLGTFVGESPTKGLLTFKVEGVDMEPLKEAILPFVEEIIDIRLAPGA